MTRLWVIVLLSVALWLGFGRLRRRVAAGGGAPPEAPPARSRQLVRCERCGIHFAPEQGSGGGGAFCSPACREVSAARGAADGGR